ncbi:ABC transporter permease [Streptomyces iconiensis]|uniref:Transport permease protein n=1 Tax=Streptomyces iconiensis TaxID=1384038 RepID=A0ABT7A1A2_9ACTN|nr:ABC transporter permease [Streptomyces iconiensis]MDJ1134844.1 ABC transporter permease [Streptomyces iconiensis]
MSHNGPASHPTTPHATTTRPGAPHAGGVPDAPAAPRLTALHRESRTVLAVVHRDLLRVLSRPTHAFLMMLHPLVFLFAFGGGLGALIPSRAVGGDYSAYLFPGILIMTIQTPAIGVGMRLIEDRTSGFLRETLMAPARRSTLLAAMCLGGTTVATVQGLVLLALAGTVGIAYDPFLMASMLTVLTVTAFTLTALTTLLAVTMTNAESFNTLLALTMLPLVFLSGGFFPLSAMPDWLGTLAAANPLAYAVDLLHHALHTFGGAPARGGVRWGDWKPPAAAELATLLVAATTTLTAAAHRFTRPD